MSYDPDLRKVKLEYSPDMCIYEYSLSEVMLRPNTRPFFIFAESNSGKTVIGVDMFVKAMSSGVFNQFQYITGTYSGEGNAYLRNKILKACCFEPKNSLDLIKRMAMIVDTLKSEQAKIQTTEQTIGFVRNEMVHKSQISGALKSDLTNLESRLAAKYQSFKNKNPYESVVRLIFDSSASSQRIFINVYKQPNFDQFITIFNSNLFELQKEIEASGQLQVMIENKQVSKSKALDNFTRKIIKTYKQYKEEELKLYKLLIKKEFQHLTKDEGSKQKILQYFQNQNQTKLLDEYTKNICEHVQDPFRACIVIDDVSGFIQQLQESKEKVETHNKQAKTLYTEVMQAILTQGRHVGNFFIALHNPDNLPSNVRQQMGNIILNAQAKSWLNTSRNFAQEKGLIMSILTEIEQYNNENGKRYNLVYFKEKSESPDPDCQFCLMQAEYIESQRFDSSQYQNNKYFKYLVEHSNSNIFQSVNNDEKNNEDSEFTDDI